MIKNKTVAAWLTFIGGPLGLHRFYLRGFGDMLGWMLPIPTALGLYGVGRVQQFGLDDQWSWVLIPLLGFTIAGCALCAIVYGLMTPEKWNAAFNPNLDLEAPSGHTNWLTVGALVFALMFGTIALMSSIVFSFQRYFEYQVEEARKISQ
jgi:membrane-associated phospholipid phosphatase